jgi:4-hydroxybenzoate polyprenyltransferase
MTARAATAADAGRTTLHALAWSMRPYQWPKNIIVFAALAFSAGQAWQAEEASTWWPLLWRAVLYFGAWCLAASAIYLVNDVRDRELDTLHPVKRRRPIASGELSSQAALIAAGVLVLGAVGGALALEWRAGAVLAGYVALMLGYCLGLKSIAVLDVLVLTGGVVARAVSGALVIGVTISPWLYICTSFGAFFVALSKRWAELRDLGPAAAKHRPALALYGSDLLPQLMVATAAGALLSYSIYTIESEHVPGNGAMALTIPFVAFALFRYLLLLSGTRKSDAPDRILFTDRQILASVVGFVVAAVWVLLAN